MELEDSRSTDPTPIPPVLTDPFKELLDQDSETVGTIVDIRALSPDTPAAAFDINRRHLLTESIQYLESVVEEGEHRDCIGIAVRLPSDEIFVDLYTFAESSTEKFPAIDSLALELDTDTTSPQQLVGKDVVVHRANGCWRIAETQSRSRPAPTVGRFHLLMALGVGILGAGAIGAAAFQYNISLPITFLLTAVGACIATAVGAYVVLARRREHPMFLLGDAVSVRPSPPPLPDGSEIVELTSGEFIEFTVRTGDDPDSETEALANLGIIVELPDGSRATIPVPAPAQSWGRTAIKEVLLSITGSVDDLHMAYGSELPLVIVDGKVLIDQSRLAHQPAPAYSWIDVVADRYVGTINRLLGVDTRQSRFESPPAVQAEPAC